MSNIISSDDPRATYVASLREFADFLESNPDVTVPTTQRTLLLSLSLNSAVEEFAAKHGLTVVFDAEGNASADMTFGPVIYHAYGYVDFAEHCDRNAERAAREWAERKGLEIVAPLVSDDTIRQAENQLALNVADREAAEAAPQPPARVPVDPASKAARLARLIAEKYPFHAMTELIDAETLNVFVTPAGLGDWDWWLGRFHIPTGQMTHRGSYSTAKGNHGSVTVLLTGYGVPALYAAQVAAQTGGAL
ncbi:hypothetical protein OG552_10160 [Streptomyces sp. NBC_01476]|uniref:hypothetical protein n=1 Tax=Streptomyces sp. NBC_01476 TaxID=2903881 RepID=UPI002E333D45|nr:hypothetical protein [Streptomyces sp. NBC_01476]